MVYVFFWSGMLYENSANPEDVGAGQGGCGLGVATPAGGQDFSVLCLGGRHTANQVRVGVQIVLRAPTQGLHQVAEVASPRRSIEGCVKLMVEIDKDGCIAAGEMTIQILKARIQLGEALFGKMGDGQAGGHLFQGGSNVVHIFQILGAERAHHRAAMRVDGDQSLGFQTVEGLAYGHGAHRKTDSHLILAQMLTRRKRATQNLLAQKIGQISLDGALQ